MDGDLGRVTVQWALGMYGKGAEVNEVFTELVTSTEYQKSGKDITKQTANGQEKEVQDDAKTEKSKKREKSKEKKAKKERRDKSLKPAETRWVHIGLIVEFVGDRDSKH